MQKTQNDIEPSERIAGFSLIDIKHALGFIGFDRPNDVGVIADALEISMSQALRVANDLERRGYVKKLATPGKHLERRDAIDDERSKRHPEDESSRTSGVLRRSTRR